MFGGKIGLPELAIIVFIALLIFGPKKLGELGKGLGEGIKNFKSSMNDNSIDHDQLNRREEVASSRSSGVARQGDSAFLSLPGPQTRRIPVSASSLRSIRYTRGTGNPTTLK